MILMFVIVLSLPINHKHQDAP